MLFKSDHPFYCLFLRGGLVGGVNPSHEYISQLKQEVNSPIPRKQWM